ncbi:MAG TPA: GntR family transcriptional regulator [Magnetospirillaceae bacterium]|nr:GntR family transcriptional regulator [Magnetospirillaceae bacterium]
MGSYRKIVTVSMREQLYEALKGLILDNSYRPRSVLAIDRIAEEFGVSATPVREALVKLEGDGFVELIPNRGALVTDIREEDVRNIWDMRLLLEPYAARECTATADGEELGILAADIRLLSSAPDDNGLYMDTDLRLHELLYLDVKNGLLLDTIRRVHQMSLRVRYFAEHRPELREVVVREVIAEHLGIIEAVRTRQPDAVEALLRTHLQNGQRRTIDALRSSH